MHGLIAVSVLVVLATTQVFSLPLGARDEYDLKEIVSFLEDPSHEVSHV